MKDSSADNANGANSDQVTDSDIHTEAGEVNQFRDVTEVLHMPPRAEDSSESIEGESVSAKETKDHLKYKVGKMVGKGGMGIVYEAKDLDFKRTVAMKVLLRGRPKVSENDFQRFVEEAQITSQLEHPNIVPVHEMGNDAKGNVFYTMKYVRGLTLTDVINELRREKVETIEHYPLQRLLNIFQKACDAVAFAHSRGVIHHDLKPANIMLGDYGEVLVLDWGLAQVVDDFIASQEARNKEPPPPIDPNAEMMQVDEKFVDFEKEFQDLLNESIHTDKIGSDLRSQSGKIVGTPGFMAPEQLQSERKYQDFRTDIYSLGAILYSILTLRPPVHGTSLEDVLHKIVNGEICPPIIFNEPDSNTNVTGSACAYDKAVVHMPVKLPHCPDGRIPTALSDIVMKAMSVDPDDRYQSVMELQRDIEAYQDGVIWNLVLDDDFSDPDLESRWEVYGGLMEIKEREGRLYGGEPQYLLFKQPLPGDVRIEFECRQESAYLTDMACFMSAVKSDNWKEVPSSGYVFKYGGYSNSTNVLERADQKLWSESASPLQRGKTYKIRAERIGSRLRMTVNGEEVFSVVDTDPLSGSDRTAIGLSGSMTDTRYACVKIYCLGTPTKADILDIADKQLQRGHYTTAMDLYQEVIDSFPDAKRMAKARKGYETARNRNSMLKDLTLWKEKLEDAWPGVGFNLRMENDGLSLDVSCTGITDLGPLRGLPLTTLYCNDNSITDLEPLREMSLTTLNCGGNDIRSLEPLRGMPLITLLCEGCPVESLEPLRGMPLTMLNCGGSSPVTGLEPLSGMKLTWLCCWDSGIEDLEPLRGMELTAFYCDGNRIQTLEPLSGMPLGRLICSGNKIESLEPLKGMPLTTLHCAGNWITDLKPLRDMSLNMLSCQCNQIVTLEPITELPLNSLMCGGNKLTGIDKFIKNPPQKFLFDCDTITTEELEWVQKTWARDFRFAEHARQAELLLALRKNDTEKLTSLASEYQGRRYLYIPKFMRWQEARVFCESLGGHLVTITSREENNFVTSLFPGGSWFWLGLYTTDQGHQWVTGETYTFGNFVDALREHKPGEKVFCGGVWTSEVYAEVSNSFMIEWE